MVETPSPKGKVAGQAGEPSACRYPEAYPAYSRQLRVIESLANGTGELLNRCAWKQDAKMPVCGKADGGGVVAKCLAVMVGTR